MAQAIIIGHWSTGRIYYATDAAAALLGVRADLLHGMSALQFFANPDQRIEAMRRLADGHKVVRAELRMRSFDGRDLCVLADVGRIIYQREPSIIFVLNDVTDYKRQESDLIEARDRLSREKLELSRQKENWRRRHEAARAASDAKSQFLARMSHELRSPLNAILGFAEIIRDERVKDANHTKYPEYAGLIHSAGTHLLGLINDVLDLSKIEAGRMEIERQPVDLSELALECLDLMEPEARRRGVRLSLKLTQRQSPHVATGDRKRCTQILINLLSNALKFTGPDGAVTIECDRLPDGRVTVSVSDTGIGMTNEEIALALEPFGQVSHAASGLADQGTGLGLPIVKSLIEAQDGEFEIASQPGEGTRITFRLPGADAFQVMD